MSRYLIAVVTVVLALIVRVAVARKAGRPSSVYGTPGWAFPPTCSIRCSRCSRRSTET
jgi:hypothetical protein